MWPDVGSIRRLIIFKVVVLPQPEPPSSTSSRPSGTRRLTSTTEKRCPPSNDLLSPSSTIMLASPGRLPLRQHDCERAEPLCQEGTQARRDVTAAANHASW